MPTNSIPLAAAAAAAAIERALRAAREEVAMPGCVNSSTPSRPCPSVRPSVPTEDDDRYADGAWSEFLSEASICVSCEGGQAQDEEGGAPTPFFGIGNRMKAIFCITTIASAVQCL